MDHLKSCPECRDEEARLRKVWAAAEARKSEAERAMEAIDWEALAQRIADRAALRETEPQARTARERGFFGWLWRPGVAYLLAGLVIGGLGMFGAFKAGLFNPRARVAYFAPRDFLDKTEAELARRETVSYLERSQYVLLDFAQTPPDKAAEWGRSAAPKAAADLLSRKKYIDPQLNRIPMAKAREICDQIEALCLELSQFGSQLSQDEWKEIQDRVRQSQLLLKIDLVKKELERHEI